MIQTRCLFSPLDFFPVLTCLMLEKVRRWREQINEKVMKIKFGEKGL